MKKYRKMLAAFTACVAVATGTMASPVYYTILHAVEEDTMEVFKYGGSGTLSVSMDDGATYQTVSSFSFDSYGRGFARIYPLNRVSADSPVKLEASFNEGDRGQPVDTVVKTTAREFLDSLSPYQRWSWLAYAPVYVSYETLPDIVDTAIGAGSFTKLVAAVQTAGLEDALRGEGPFTVFAPTDDAFAALGLTDEELLALPNLGDILLYHVVSGSLDGDDVSTKEHLETLLCKDVEVEIIGEDLFINNAKVVIANIEASNGIIHVIDTVLLPPTLPNIVETAASDERFETLVAALQSTGLDAALTNEGPFTVFAPTDDAFEALATALEVDVADLLDLPELADVLLYHVANGRLKAENVVEVERITTLLGEDVKVNVTPEGVFINEAKIIIADIKAENGIIHVIDDVLIPEEMPDIVDIAIGAGQFDTLVGALRATGLDEILRGDGPFTVFAPTDEAFEQLPSWLLRYLIRNPAYLKQVLLYHVVPGDLSASEVLEQKKLITAQGRAVYLSQNGEDVFINRSKVIAADIEAENGTVHVIDRVLIPWFRY